MTRIEYDLLREQEPQLKLPNSTFYFDDNTSRLNTGDSTVGLWIKCITPDQLRAARMGELLANGRFQEAGLLRSKMMAQGAF